MFLIIIPKLPLKTIWGIYGVGLYKLPEKILKTCDQHIDVYFDKIWYKKIGEGGGGGEEGASIFLAGLVFFKVTLIV